MPRTVLLTGYSGFLGRHTLEALERAGWQVYVAGRTPPANGSHAGYIPIDLDRPETFAVLRQIAPLQAIVHLACHVGWNGSSEAEMFAPNVLATGFLADIGRRWNAHVVFASAALVHGVAAQVISRESPVTPDIPYARSKWLGETLLDAAGVDHCILRMGGLFGRAGPSHLGLNKAIDACLQGQPPTVVGRGSARRNYLFVKDAAQAIASALEQRVTGTHLLAGPEVLTIRAMLAQICATLNPGSRPLEMDGQEAADQVIERSAAFGSGISFSAALRDVADEAQTCVSR